MAKKNRQRKRPPNSQAQQQRVQQVRAKAADLLEPPDALEMDADQDRPRTGHMPAVTPTGASPDNGEVGFVADEEALESLIRQMTDLQQRHERELKDLDRERSLLERGQVELRNERERTELAVKALAAREESLSGIERDLAERELDAEIGFAQKERTYRDDLRAQMDKLREELREAVEDLEFADVRGIKERVSSFQALRDDVERSVAAREVKLMDLRLELEEEQGKLRLEKRALKADSRQLAMDQEAFQSEKADALASERAMLEVERGIWAQERAVLESSLDKLAATKASLEDRDRALRFVDPVQLEQDKADLFDKLRGARDELARRPTQEEVDEVRDKTRLLDQRDRQVRESSERAADLEIQLESVRFEMEKMKLVDSRNANLTVQKAALSADVEELRRTLSDLSERRITKHPFQQCVAMDSDSTLCAQRELWNFESGLEELVEYLAEAMAAQGLFYDGPTIRSFIAGMSSSKLHILQGISGTGKSSLPAAIAAAFGVECLTVEVQAAWRDRQDLLGYFNPFEHRYEETAFLTALYAASTERHAFSPFFILLDEMNLSHPEQYLADVFSAMERPEGDQYLRLMNHAVEPWPVQLVDGMRLRLPPNVWIVGTANHDETTVSFAPKTYDRAHVYELPTQHPSPWDGQSRDSNEPLSLERLQTLFDAAVMKNPQEAASKASDFLATLRSDLAKMDIGWGNRIERQLKQYAPVVVASGGSIREATDVFVSMKVLNKLVGRYEYNVAQLDGLKDSVLAAWEELPGSEIAPDRMLDLIQHERQRIG